MTRSQSGVAAVVQFLAGAALLALCGLFAFSAESPVDHFPLLGRIAAAFPALAIAFLFSPVVSVAIVTIPALLSAILYLAPGAERRIVGLAVLWGAISLTPVVPAVASWALYSSCGMAGIVLMARSLEDRFGERLVFAASRLRVFVAGSSWRSFLVTVALVHLALTVLISYSFFGAVPHVMDSVAQRFHAKIFARGSVAAPAPPVPDAFEYSHLVIREGRWYSMYFPAHPFLVALFLRLGIAPLANPIIGVLGLLGIAFLARIVAGDRVARLAAILLLISPWWLLMHAEGMNHVTASAALSWALVLFVQSGRQVEFRRTFIIGVASGLLFGIAFLVRPYTPLLVGAALVGFALWRAIRNGERNWLWSTVAIAIGAIPAVALILEFNILTTGAPFLTAYVVKQGPGTAPGFHAVPWGPPHTLLLGLRNILADLNALNRWVLGLPLPLALLAVGFRRKVSTPGWLWGVPAALLIGHFAFWYVDFCFGPRYLFEALPCMMILAAVALGEISSRAPRQVALVCLLSLLGAPMIWLGVYQNYGHAYYGVDDRSSAAVVAATPDDALVFIPPEQYGAYFWRNDPWLEHGPIYARDRGAQNAAVVAAFPHRKVFRAEGNRLQRILIR